MKIAIYDSGSESFSHRWIAYCVDKGLSYKVIDFFKSDIIEQLSDCDCIMWHHNQVLPRDVLIARGILNALEISGKRVFPDLKTAWHFDDKLAQKYFLESVGAPLVPVYVSYSKSEAFKWIEQAEFPKVFKLRGGAGSKNVLLVKNKAKAKKLINKAFGKGFRQYDAWGGTLEQWRRFKLGKASVKDVIKAFAHLVYLTQLESIKPRERGYIYFQDYISGNDNDIRVVVIGDKAFAIKRLVRRNDFRASGSGHIIYSKNEIDINCVRLAFKLNKKLKAQCLAFDFVHDENKVPKILEMSYGFTAKGYDLCPGYWNENLEWFEGQFNPYGWMIENLISGFPMTNE